MTDLRADIRARLEARDHAGFTDVMVRAVVAGRRADEVEAMALDVMASMPDEVRHFWLVEECPCSRCIRN